MKNASLFAEVSKNAEKYQEAYEKCDRERKQLREEIHKLKTLPFVFIIIHHFSLLSYYNNLL